MYRKIGLGVAFFWLGFSWMAESVPVTRPLFGAGMAVVIFLMCGLDQAAAARCANLKKMLDERLPPKPEK